MRRQLIAAAMATVVLSGCAHVVNAQTTCLPASGKSAGLVDYVNHLLTAADSAYVPLRSRFGLSGVTTSQVSLVTDERICSQAASAIDRMAGVRNSGRRVYVVQAGTRYLVQDPNGKAGEWTSVIVYDPHFTYVGVLLGP